MASGVSAIPKIEVDAVSVVTNTTPTGAFRGAGRPEAAQAIERALDLFAAEAGLDPADVRRRNFIPRDAFPYKTASGARYDCGDYAGALELVLAAAGYESLRDEQRRRREQDGARQLGVGLSTYVEITAGLPEAEFGAVEDHARGSGQSSERAGSRTARPGPRDDVRNDRAADRLGVPVESVSVLKGDTDEVSRGTGTYASKSTQLGGTAAAEAADAVVERGRQLAADMLEAGVEDVVLDRDTGSFHVAGAPQLRADVGRAGRARGRGWAPRGSTKRERLQG